MADTRATAAIADYLYRVRAAGTTLASWPPERMPLDEAHAYKVQDALLKKLIPEEGPLAGYKIGLTAPAIWEQTGMKSPAYGPIRAKRVYQGVARLRADKWVRLGLELEVLLTVAKDVPTSSTPWDKDSITPYVGSARAAFELIEDRGADYSKPNVFGLIGLVGWNGGSCVGPDAPGWANLDIGNLDGEVFFNGRRIAGGNSRDVLGHPYNSLAFLANKLAEHGKRLRKGMIVSTGSMVACQFIPPETEAVGRIAGLGEVRVIYDLPKAAARKSAVKPATRRAGAGAKKAGARRARRT